jgi:hypothetical protein
VASAALSVVFQEALPSAKASVAATVERATALARQWAARRDAAPMDAIPREAAFVPNRSVPDIEQYERYFSEAMPLLRADASVTFLNVEVPAAALRHHSNGRTRKRQVPYALRARGSSFPALAVSRNAHAFLESMRLTFVDPRALPPTVLGAVLTSAQASGLSAGSPREDAHGSGSGGVAEPR